LTYLTYKKFYYLSFSLTYKPKAYRFFYLSYEQKYLEYQDQYLLLRIVLSFQRDNYISSKIKFFLKHSWNKKYLVSAFEWFS